MAKLDLNVRPALKQSVTPELSQAFKLMQLPVVELNQHLLQALSENVLLEVETPITQDAQQEQDDDWATNTITIKTPNSGPPPEDAGIEEQVSLHDHLEWQLATQQLNAQDLAIGRAVIDAIDDNGYLRIGLSELSQSMALPFDSKLADWQRMLATIQSFDPTGVGARNASECLCLQLQTLSLSAELATLAKALCENHLEVVAKRDIAALAKALNADPATVSEAVAIIRGLNPHPGLSFNTSNTHYLVPDAMVVKRNNRWEVDINQNYLPKLGVNKQYAKALRGSDHLSLKTQLQEARWLIRALSMRHETLKNVATAIVQNQQAFFEHGDSQVKPMTMQELATLCDVHESTISRVTANKTFQSPRGNVSFRHFFSHKFGDETQSGTSSVAIKAQVRTLIENEDSAQPLSDQALVEILKAQGVTIARRTIAKYRNQLGFPNAAERRRS